MEEVTYWIEDAMRDVQLDTDTQTYSDYGDNDAYPLSDDGDWGLSDIQPGWE